ncbi:MAG: HAD family hydrolase [Prevotella sp.]|nr:HAD family hydrolase [Prevotella sp.]MCM1075659.1 HAD family hydrolase [Ruminococcus sp.]
METLDFAKVKGIIFDYGGTLDTRGNHWSHVIWNAYQRAGVLVENEAFRDAYVYGERELARTLRILPHHDFHDLLLIKMQIELQYLADGQFINPEEIQPKAKEIADLCYQAARDCIEEAKPVLKQLSKKYPLVLVSNFYGNVQTVLKDFGIDIYFQKVIESAVVGIRKPDPRIFELGVQALGLKPEDVLVVGDSYKKDIAPSMSLGCQTIWIKGRGWTAEEDAILHPAIITSISHVLNLLDGK